MQNENNNVQGSGNVTETGTNNTYIMGENNTVRGLSRNNIVVGNQNQIANSINNANVYGTLGEVTATNSIVLGGTAGGSVGDYGSWVERGVIINKSGVLSIARERDTIKTSGTTTGWQPTGIASGTDFAMRVRGATNMIIEWNSNITFTQIKTGVAL